MTLQKNFKSRVFLVFEKKVKNVFSNYGTSYNIRWSIHALRPWWW